MGETFSKKKHTPKNRVTKKTGKTEAYYQKLSVLRNFKASCEYFKLNISAQKKILNLYQDQILNVCCARISQINNQLVSLQQELEAYDPEKVRIDDITYKERYVDLVKKINKVLEQSQQILQAKEGVRVSIKSGDPNNKTSRAKLESVIPQEMLTNQKSEDINFTVFTNLYTEFSNRTWKKELSNELELNLEGILWRYFMKRLKTLTFPNLDKLCLKNISYSDLPLLRKFLITSFSKKVDSLQMLFVDKKSGRIVKFIRDILNATYKVKARV
ncbi:unnamed protein product [Moneuplotes crassus]|uniref:Uncharacterized protein n=1 Tax=Euplotes crassus TaxID=5936 RepID=A0AAD1UL67_EUPCR|nr:unnamed protein product [Moneuplotes crassus]